MIELSVVIPVYNEEASIASLIEETAGVISDGLGEVEIVVVDDGSTDGTWKVLTAMKPAHPALRAIRFQRNAGQSAAMACGFLKARGRCVVSMDGDGQNDPADIPEIVKWLEEHDVVCGIRRKRRDSVAKRWGSRLANQVRRWVTGDRIVDIGCSLKGYRREFLQDLPYFDGIHRFFPIFLEMKGCSVKQVPVNHRPRMAGVSKYSNLRRLARTWLDLLGVRWMQMRQLRYHIEEDI